MKYYLQTNIVVFGRNILPMPLENLFFYPAIHLLLGCLKVEFDKAITQEMLLMTIFIQNEQIYLKKNGIHRTVKYY